MSAGERYGISTYLADEAQCRECDDTGTVQTEFGEWEACTCPAGRLMLERHPDFYGKAQYEAEQRAVERMADRSLARSHARARLR